MRQFLLAAALLMLPEMAQAQAYTPTDNTTNASGVNRTQGTGDPNRGDPVNVRAVTCASGTCTATVPAPSATWSYAAPAGGITNTTTAVTIKAAAGAGVRNYVKSLQIGGEATGGVTNFVIRDGAAGTVLWRMSLAVTAQGSTKIVTFDPPLRGTANTLLEIATETAVTGGIYADAQGFVGN